MTRYPMHLELKVGPRHFRLPRDPYKCGVVYDDRLSGANRLSVERMTLGPAGTRRYEVPGMRLTVLDYEHSRAAAAEPLAGQDSLDDAAEVEGTFPIYVYADKRIIVAPRLVVGIDEARIDVRTLARTFDLKPVSVGTAYAVFAVPIGVNVLELTAAMMTLPGVRYVEPELLTVNQLPRASQSAALKLDSAAPVTMQRAFVNIALAQAHALLAGAKGTSVRVAVLDDGLDLTHPVLTRAYTAGYDATADRELDRPNDWDYHGTACAGLLCGYSENPPYNGVAPDVALLGIRIASSPGRGQPWMTSNFYLRRGIDWAVAQGADVLSCSWGSVPSATVADGIAQAGLTGRHGKGSLCIFAAGNSGWSVEFPATLRGVVAVGAVNLDDQLKTRDSSDGETWWASSYGPEISLAAPGVKLVTSDNRAAAGYGPGDWRDNFNGTSASCPIVAGAAALVLSVAPGLTGADVMRLLTDTADKVGAQPYDAAGRNDFLGYGRLNIAAAVARALALTRGENAPETVPPASSLKGTVLRIALSSDLSLYGIVPSAGAMAFFAADPADTPALNAASAGLDLVEVRYDAQSESPIGTILWRARLSALGDPSPGKDPAPDPAPADDVTNRAPGPNEVLLPLPGTDVFALT